MLLHTPAPCGAPLPPGDTAAVADGRHEAPLDGYIAAFEHSDARLLEHVLRTDATLEVTPFRE